MVQTIVGPPKDDNDIKGGPPGGGQNKFLGLFGGEKKAIAQP